MADHLVGVNKVITEEELDRWEEWLTEPDAEQTDFHLSRETTLRLIAEVRRLREMTKQEQMLKSQIAPVIE